MCYTVVMVILQNKKIICAVLVLVLMVGLIPVGLWRNNVGAISKACQNSAACREAVEKEQQATKNAANAASTANAYQAKVSELNVEIAGKEVEIAQTEAEIRDAYKSQQATLDYIYCKWGSRRGCNTHTHKRKRNKKEARNLKRETGE